MSRLILPFAAKDVSSLARALSRELDACEAKPSHVQLLNMLTRSVGYQNFQHFRAQFKAKDRLERISATPPEPIDHRQVERVLRHFDAAGRLVRWPSKESQQIICLWVLWSRLPVDAAQTEMEITAFLRAHHLFGDPALLRRALYEYGMVSRTSDGRDYRRIERRPPPEALAAIRHLGARVNP